MHDLSYASEFFSYYLFSFFIVGSGDMINNFGIEVNMRMTTVAGRVIMAPELKLGGAHNGRMSKITVDRNRCHWNFVGKSVVEGKHIDRWT